MAERRITRLSDFGDPASPSEAHAPAVDAAFDAIARHLMEFGDQRLGLPRKITGQGAGCRMDAPLRQRLGNRGRPP